MNKKTFINDVFIFCKRIKAKLIYPININGFLNKEKK